MKTILVPTDFSEYGNNGISLAISLAEKTGAQLILQHNIPALLEWHHHGDEDADRKKTLKKINIAEDNFKTIRKIHPLNKIEVREVITEGITDEEVVKEAKKIRADLVVLGSHKNEKNDRVFIGSTFQKIMREVTCPVITVNRPIPQREWKRVLVPASFDFDITKPLEKILAVLSGLSPTIHLLFVNTPDHFKDEKLIEQQMQSCIEAFPGVKFEKHVYNQQEVETGILEVAEKIEADLIAMYSHDRTRKEKYNIGTSEAIAFRSPIPLLTVLVEK
jgi:nucleotide-binding universal stress UspA family protein